MKRLLVILSSLLVLGGLTACHSSSDTGAAPEGMYTGILPCENCAGIKTAITFNKDGSVIETQLYENTDGDSLSQAGTWQMNKGIITATFPFAMQYFVVTSPDTIEMTNEKGESVKNMSKQYTLTKMTPKTASFFTGRYKPSAAKSTNPGNQPASNGTASSQTANNNAPVMTIMGNSQDGVNVSFTTEGVKEGCTINAQGKVVNDQIEIPLQSVNPKLQSTLVIRSTGPQIMNVFTSRAKDKNDLGLLCTNGQVVGGDYVKAD